MLLLAEANQFCAETYEIWQFVGYIMLIFKIVIPLILLILGMFDLGKAVVASDDKAIQKAAKSLAMRAVAAIVIFFIPTLIKFAFSIVNGFQDDPAVRNNYNRCADCLTSPTNSGKCNNKAISTK